MGLGDYIERALNLVGITKTRVEKWLGRPCNCTERQDKLNQLGWWAKRVISGKTAGMDKHLSSIMEDEG